MEKYYKCANTYLKIIQLQEELNRPDFPDMKKIQKVTYGNRSGIIIVTDKNKRK